MLSTASKNQVLLAQADSLAALVIDNPDLTVSARLALAAQVSAHDALVAFRGTKRKSKVIAPGDRCCARVWGSGSGHDQCNITRIEGSRYCKQHTTKSQQRVLNGTLVNSGEEGYGEAEVLGARPCVLCETTHKRVGLFTGDIEDECTAKDAEGRFVVKWNNEETKGEMEDARASGTFEWHPWAPGHGTEAVAAKKGSKGSKGSKGGGASKKEKKKPEKKAKQVRGKNAYLFYASSVREQIMAEVAVGGEKVKQADVAKRAGAMWKELSQEEKAPFEDAARADKLEKQAAADAAAKEELTVNGGSAAEVTVNGGSAAEVTVNGGSAAEVPVAKPCSAEMLVEAATAAVSVEDAAAKDIFDGLEALGEDDFSDDEEAEEYDSDGGTKYMRYAGDDYDELVLREDYEDEEGEEPAVVAHLYPDGRLERVDGPE